MFRFNNCRKRDHVDLYGNDAFFDLDMFGSQAEDAHRLARELTPGQTCIVATPDLLRDLSSEIMFAHYQFSTAEIMRDRERDVNCYVYFGKLVKADSLSRADAKRHDIYKHFFNVNGHFKRRSVQRAN